MGLLAIINSQMNYVYLRTIGAVDTKIFSTLRESMSRILPFPIKLMQDNRYPLSTLEPRENQYYANKIIEYLAAELPDDCVKLLCITDIDLCTPVLSFIYGEAQFGGRVSVVSLYRLKQEFYHLPPNDEILIERLVKECIHELGHCYGLVHCEDAQCAMFFSNTILTIDNKEKAFCLRCKNWLNGKIRKESHEQK
jgi:archaemetzincin